MIKQVNNLKQEKQDIFYRILKVVLRVYKVMGISLLCLAFALLIINFSPDLYYYVDSGAVTAEKDLLVNTIYAQSAATPTPSSVFVPVKVLPPVDTTLPTTTTLIINKIGVKATIHIGGNGESGLNQGVWQPDSFGDPTSDIPMLLASHRYGLLSWSTDFRNNNSFYRLPDLNPGDELIVVYQQRPFKYIIKAKFESKKIENVQADLIMYTCKFFRSPDRIILTADKAW